MNDQYFQHTLTTLVRAAQPSSESALNNIQMEELKHCQQLLAVIHNHGDLDAIDWKSINSRTAMQMLMVAERIDLLSQAPLPWLSNSETEHLRAHDLDLTRGAYVSLEPNCLVHYLLMPYSLSDLTSHEGNMQLSSKERVERAVVNQQNMVRALRERQVFDAHTTVTCLNMGVGPSYQCAVGNIALAFQSIHINDIVRGANPKTIGTDDERLRAVCHGMIQQMNRKAYTGADYSKCYLSEQEGQATLWKFAKSINGKKIDLMHKVPKTIIVPSCETVSFMSTGELMVHALLHNVYHHVLEARGPLRRNKEGKIVAPTKPIPPLPKHVEEVAKLLVQGLERLPPLERPELIGEILKETFFHTRHRVGGGVKPLLLRTLFEMMSPDLKKDVFSMLLRHTPSEPLQNPEMGFSSLFWLPHSPSTQGMADRQDIQTVVKTMAACFQSYKAPDPSVAENLRKSLLWIAPSEMQEEVDFLCLKFIGDMEGRRKGGGSNLTEKHRLEWSAIEATFLDKTTLARGKRKM